MDESSLMKRALQAAEGSLRSVDAFSSHGSTLPAVSQQHNWFAVTSEMVAIDIMTCRS
jgi:hypothetical protein